MSPSRAAHLLTVPVLTVLLAALGFARPATPLPRPDGVDHQSAAENFLARHGRPGATAETLTIGELLEEEFLTVPLGAFEFSIPRRTFTTPSERERFRQLCLNLLDAQNVWLDWVAPGSELDKTAPADFKTVRKWVAKWDVEQLELAAQDGTGTLDDLVGTTDVQRAASERLTAALTGGALSGTGESIDPVRVVALPNRADFVELLCVVGFLRPNLRQYFWVDRIETWHEFRLTDEKVYCLAMAYPAEGVTGATYSAGDRMDEENPLALGEQVVQLAMGELLNRLFHDLVPPTVVHSLAINLVIEQFGEIDTRADGRLEGRSTSAREFFVPGGRSEGGVLPTNSADNRWRFERGKNHFLRTLRQAQKDGAKERDATSRIKHANFVLRSHDDAVKKPISAPFLGSDIEPPPAPPQALVEDQSEFLRAYRCAFVHWMRTASGRSKKDAPKLFAGWLRELAQLESPEAFETTFADAFAAPLSNAELDKDSLEGQFLIWLTRQRGS